MADMTGAESRRRLHEAAAELDALAKECLDREASTALSASARLVEGLTADLPWSGSEDLIGWQMPKAIGLARGHARLSKLPALSQDEEAALEQSRAVLLRLPELLAGHSRNARAGAFDGLEADAKLLTATSLPPKEFGEPLADGEIQRLAALEPARRLDERFDSAWAAMTKLVERPMAGGLFNLFGGLAAAPLNRIEAMRQAAAEVVLGTRPPPPAPKPAVEPAGPFPPLRPQWAGLAAVLAVLSLFWFGGRFLSAPDTPIRPFAAAEAAALDRDLQAETVRRVVESMSTSTPNRRTDGIAAVETMLTGDARKGWMELIRAAGDAASKENLSISAEGVRIAPFSLGEHPIWTAGWRTIAIGPDGRTRASKHVGATLFLEKAPAGSDGPKWRVSKLDILP